MSARFEPFKRELTVRWVPNPLKGSAATFLWGPRQTGKTTLLRQQLPDALYYDLLDTDLSADLTVRPRRLREEVLAQDPAVVVVDEVQSVPAFIDEVHWLLESTSTRFVLCGSSARSLRRRSHGLPWQAFCDQLWAGDIVGLPCSGVMQRALRLEMPPTGERPPGAPPL